MDTTPPPTPPVKKKRALTISSWVLFVLSIIGIFFAPVILSILSLLVAGMFGANISNAIHTVTYGSLVVGSLGSIGFIPFAGVVTGLIAGIKTKSAAAWVALVANGALWLVCVVAFFATM